MGRTGTTSRSCCSKSSILAHFTRYVLKIESNTHHFLSQNERSSISAVLRFRRALAFIQNEYPFSFAFGPADTREHCIESAQQVFRRLLLRSPGDEVIPFETIALLTENEDGEIDQDKAKDLIKLFRPDRQGNLTVRPTLHPNSAFFSRTSTIYFTR